MACSDSFGLLPRNTFAPRTETLCRAQKPGKAPGPDTVQNEIWRVRPEYAGRWLWPLCYCISTGAPEPPSAPSQKGPGGDFRSIAMLSGVVKLWHSHVRSSVGQQVLSHHFPTQLGGRKGIDTGIALAVFRCAADLAEAGRRSWAAFFVDIQAANFETDRPIPSLRGSRS